MKLPIYIQYMKDYHQSVSRIRNKILMQPCDECKHSNGTSKDLLDAKDHPYFDPYYNQTRYHTTLAKKHNRYVKEAEGCNCDCHVLVS